jgi:hypothetical protein
VDGGKFGHGFVASFLSSKADGVFGLSDLEGGQRIVANAIVAGTISEVTGGKYANGAMSAAFRVAFNDTLDGKKDKLINKIRDLQANNPGKPIHLSKGEMDTVFQHTAEYTAWLDLQPADSDFEFQMNNADSFLFHEKSFQAQKFIVEGYNDNNGKGYNGSTINYLVLGMRAANVDSSILGRAALAAHVFDYNRKQLEIGGNEEYMRLNREQAIGGGQIWANNGFNYFKENYKK